MTKDGDRGAVRRDWVPEAQWHLVGLLAIVAVIACLIGVTREALDEAARGVMPPALLYTASAIAAMASLYLAGYAADRLWRASVKDGGAIGGLTDPITGLTAPYRRADNEDAAALRLEQAGHIFRQLDVMMAITVANAVFVAAAIWSQSDRRLLAAWATLIVIGAMSAIRVRLRAQNRPRPEKVSKRALRRIAVHAGWRGLAWGAAFALFFADAGLTGKLILGSVSVGMLAGGVLALAPIPAAALLYGLGVMAPTILRLVSFGSGDLAILAMFGITYSGSMMIVAYQLYYNFATNHAARREQAEQAATISMLLREFEASASDWLWETDADGRLTRLPERVATMLGLPSSADRPAPRLVDLFADAAESGEAVRTAISETRAFRDHVVRLRDASGADRWLSLTGSPKPDGGFRGVGSDVTERAIAREERQAALARAEQAEQRLKDGISSMRSGFALTDTEGRIRIANQSFHEIFTAAALIGEAPRLEAVLDAQARLWQADTRPETQHFRAALIARPEPGAASVDVELPTRRWLRVKRTATSEGGTVTVLTDVTDIKNQEARLALQARQLAASNQELEQFAAVASHDLQEPLRKIEAFGKRLSQRTQGKIDDESAHFLDRMMSATGRMRGLITDLLSYSRVGRREGSHREIDLDRLLADVLDDLAMAVADRKGRVEAGQLGRMLGEPTQMRQLFQNLLSNAFKFQKPDSAPVVTIARVEGPGRDFTLLFKDNGIGFDMQHHDKIFEIFQRLHGREEYEGTGIGLATCRKIVERHGGHLTADSAPGAGATFIAAFPGSLTVAEPSGLSSDKAA